MKNPYAGVVHIYIYKYTDLTISVIKSNRYTNKFVPEAGVLGKD